MRSLFGPAFLAASVLFSGCGGDGSHEPENHFNIGDHDVYEKAATAEEVANAFCLPPVKFSKEDLEINIQAMSEKELSEIYDRFVDPSEFGGMRKELDLKCKDAICKLQSVFGATDDVVEKMIFIIRTYGFNTSPYQSGVNILNDPDYGVENRRIFSSSQLDSIIRALKSMPAHFYTKSDRALLVFVDKLNDGNTIANASITVSNLWAKKVPELQIYTLIHELGHRLDANVVLSQSWRDLSGWSVPPSGLIQAHNYSSYDRTKINPSALVSEYAHENPYEDWAESVAAYRFVPHKLKKASIDKYNWIRYQVFSGIEYISEESCHVAPLCRPGEIEKEFSAKVLNKSANACRYYAAFSLINRLENKTEAYDCLVKDAIEESLAEISARPPKDSLAMTALAGFTDNCRNYSDISSVYTGVSLAKGPNFYAPYAKEYKDLFEKHCDAKIDQLKAFKGTCDLIYGLADSIGLNFESSNPIESKIGLELFDPLNEKCRAICDSRLISKKSKPL